MASKRHVRRSACKGKHRFARKQHAEAALKTLKSASNFTGGDLAVYACQFCGGYHFGHISYRQATSDR